MKIWKRDHYEKLMGLKPPEKTVSQYQNDIQETQKKIEELQGGCKHPEYDVIFYSWRPGDLQPGHICKTCQKYLGSATEEESRELWAKSGFSQSKE